MNNVPCPSYSYDSRLSLQRTSGISESKLSRPTSDYSEAFEPSNAGPCASPDRSRYRTPEKWSKNHLYDKGVCQSLRKLSTLPSILNCRRATLRVNFPFEPVLIFYNEVMRAFQIKKRVFQFVLLGCFVCSCVSCHRDSSQMIGDLQGGSLADAARNQLRSLGFDSGWAQKIQTNPDDHSRPRHDFLEMKGPFSDLGVSGQLELTFYNDRLMDAQFTPSEPERYFRLLSKRLGKLAETSGQPQRISAEVSLSYYRDAGGNVRFYWDFLPVSKEWKDWVAKYSFVFSPQLNPSS